jgi:hypothetical protein
MQDGGHGGYPDARPARDSRLELRLSCRYTLPDSPIAILCSGSNGAGGPPMKVTLDLTPDEGARLFAAARMTGIDLLALVRDLPPESEAFVRDLAAQTSMAAHPAIDAENAAAIAWLEQRMAEDAVAELRRNLNANRAATGERPVSR